MGDKHGVQPGCEGGINIRLRTVAYHPRGGGIEPMLLDQVAIAPLVFLGQDFDRGEPASQSAALQLVGLFEGMPLGDQQ